MSQPMTTPTRAELEARAGIQSLDLLQAKRSALVADAAPLRALYGSFGGWDAKRKVLLAIQELRVRDEAARAETKLTEGKVDALAHASAAYQAFIDQSNLERSRWIILEDAIDALTEQINRDQALLRYLTSEPK